MKKTVVGLLSVSRIPNLTIIALVQIIVTVQLLEKPLRQLLYDVHFLGLVISTALIGAGGYVINDYFDQKMDFVNRPDKVLVGVSFRRRPILFLHIVFTIFGILIGFWSKFEVGVLHIFSAGALWIYSSFAKRELLIGTLIISFLTALSIFIVMVFWDNYNPVAMAYALFGCVSIFIRESIKDIISATGEQQFGVKSVPIVWGVRKAKQIIYIAGVIGTSLLMFYLWKVDNWVVRVFFIALSAPLAIFFYRISRADKEKDFRKLVFFSDTITISGLVSMLLV